MKVDWDNLRTLGRRGFVKKASAAGVSALSLGYGTKDGLVQAAGSENEVPFVRYLHGHGENRKPIYDSIPRDEWADRWTAINLKNHIAETIGRRWGAETGVSPMFVAMDESPTGFGVRVDYITRVERDGTVREPEVPFDEVRSTLPQSGSGAVGSGQYRERRSSIPVRIKHIRQIQTGDCDTGDEVSSKC